MANQHLYSSKGSPSRTRTNPTLSDSLRQRQSPSSSGCGSSSSRVRMADNGVWVSSKTVQGGGNFVSYLPQDEAVAAGLGADEGGLDPVESQRVVDLLNRELSRLLKLNPRDFWKEVASDVSLHAFLESFLKYRSRWYDFPYRGAKGMVAGVIVGEFELSRRVFMILYRISSNRDPDARASDTLSVKDHAVILQEKKLLDLPKLLDICAIYSHENEELTRIIVANAMKAQPMIHENLSAVMHHFHNIVHTMYRRCNTSLEVLFSSHNARDEGSARLHEGYLEVMDFINDAIVSMDAFVSAYKHAAIYFSCPVETRCSLSPDFYEIDAREYRPLKLENLMKQDAQVSEIPWFMHAIRWLITLQLNQLSSLSYGSEELLKTLARLHDSLLPSLLLGFQSLFSANKDGHQDTCSDILAKVSISLKMLSSRIVKFGWKLLYLCYLSEELFEESFPFPAATKIFPAQVEDPFIRADILVQTLREINEECATVQEGSWRQTFLQSIEKNHQLMGRIESLGTEGWISMDNEQLHFLNGIILIPGVKEISRMPVSRKNDIEIDEGNAILESKISQVKDLFPDYGKGFIAACLEVYNLNPEEVIQRILEGTLHNDLLSLDASLEVIPPKTTPSLSRDDKGKGKLVEYRTPTPMNAVPLVGKPQPENPSSTSSSSVGRFVRKSTMDVPDSEILNTKDEKDSAKTVALLSLLEYEDEYDDSFDDLGLSVGDSGLDDLSEKVNSSDSSASNASKWGSRQKPQFFVKDGKNYSYKVSGSVAAANYNEASIVNQAQKEMIHGLGRGGNFPMGAAKKVMESNADRDGEREISGSGGRGNSMRRGGGRNNYRKDDNGPTKSSGGQDAEQHNVVEGGGRGNSMRGRGWGRGNIRKDQTMTESTEGEDENESAGVQGRGGRGRGRRGGGRSNHYRKDQAMKKHFSGLSGF